MNWIIIKLSIPVVFRNAHRESYGVMARDVLVACQTAVTLQYQKEQKNEEKVMCVCSGRFHQAFRSLYSLSAFVPAHKSRESQRELMNDFVTNERRDAISLSHQQPPPTISIMINLSFQIVFLFLSTISSGSSLPNSTYLE